MISSSPGTTTTTRLTSLLDWHRALWLVPLVFGLFSVAMRQDNNWDLRNYHLYNPFALLNDKIGLDLAPAQMQTYFNPAIDLLHYGLIQMLPAPLVGFLMGVLHGLNYILLACIARELLPREGGRGDSRLWILLALAGMVSPGFASELGNTMGDNLTALFILSSLLLVLRGWQRLVTGQGNGLALAAGAIAGLGCGLKLTNAIHVLALCLALLTLPGTALLRIRTSFLFGLGVLAGMAFAGGFWYWKMWTLFGNPLFPQFNSFFLNPLAAPVGVADTRWLPRDLGEKLLWPFIFGFDPLRVSEVRLRLFVWPVLYLAFALLALGALARRLPWRAALATGTNVGATDARLRLLWSFFAISYLLWLNLFSIHRYLVPLEMLAPLVLWLIGQRLKPGPRTGRTVAIALLLLTLASLTITGWGRASWALAFHRAEIPLIKEPEQSMVLTVHADPPMGWLITLFPSRLAFAALASNFPEGEGYRARLEQMLNARKGPIYMIGKSARALIDPEASAAQRAAATVVAHAIQDEGGIVLARYGLELVAGSCKTYQAYLGRNPMDYQLCLVKRGAAQPIPRS